MFLAQTPDKWAEIAERVGIPFAILLMVFFFLAACAAWFAKNVVKPVTAGHLKFMHQTGEAIQTLKQQEIAQTAAVQAIAKTQDQTLEVAKDVQSQVKQLKGMVSRRDSRGSSSGSGSVEAAPAA